MIVTPFWQTGGETETLAPMLTDALAQADAPASADGVVYAVDTGREPVLQTAPADIRLERDAGGGLILVGPRGDFGHARNTETMSWGLARAGEGTQFGF